MKPLSPAPAAITQPTPRDLALSGAWTARGIGPLRQRLASLRLASRTEAIAVVGCFHGFRAKGGADSVGRQTTRSVVQSIFLVIVADALFSIAFSALDL